MVFYRLILLLSAVFFSCASFAEIEQTLIRRIAVFPIADANFAKSEDAWWQMREALTLNQRFQVASRRFMINRGVFQPRKDLKPADAIILAKILDAQALVVSYVKDREFFVKVFDGENGYLLWQEQVGFHPAISINDQIIKAATKSMNSFRLALPYQGFQVVDESINKPVYEDGAKKFAQVFIGSGSGVKAGDPVQWIRVTGDSSGSFLNSAPVVMTVAEGKVSEVKGDRAVVELIKMSSDSVLVENALVRFPMEAKRLVEASAGSDGLTSKLEAEYLTSEMKSVGEFNRDHSEASSSMAWILNLAAFILLAF